jgi:hypothetical protein
VAGWQFSTTAAEENQYRLEIRFFKVSAAADTKNTFVVPDGPMFLDNDLQWDPNLSRYSNVKHVNSIEMICKMNSKSSLKIQSEETIESLVPDEKNSGTAAGRTFRLSKMRHPDALEMAVVLNEYNDEDRPFLLQYKTEISQMSGRTHVDGVQLDVGKPVIQKSSIESSMRLELGYWFINSLKFDDDYIVLVGKLDRRGD